MGAMHGAQTRLAALLAGLAVALGAFGAHAMTAYDAHALQTFETAVRYQMYHSLALGLCAVLALHGHRTNKAATCFLLGIVLFSGSLYGVVFLEARWLGAITPSPFSPAGCCWQPVCRSPPRPRPSRVNPVPRAHRPFRLGLGATGRRILDCAA
jgi:uncharacterized membrane protein YgdD (TMEM256/DUF423 family)